MGCPQGQSFLPEHGLLMPDFNCKYKTTHDFLMQDFNV